MVSKNILLSFIAHSLLVGAFFLAMDHKEIDSLSIPIELQLDSVHVHHFENKPQTRAKTGISLPQKNSEPPPPESTETSGPPSDSRASDSQPNAGPESVANSTSRYLSQILQIISHQKFYPKASLLNEESGIVEARLTLDSNGSLLNAEIKKSSGFSNLDAAALKTIQSIARFPAPPPELGSPLKISVPIRYEINPDH